MENTSVTLIYCLTIDTENNCEIFCVVLHYDGKPFAKRKQAHLYLAFAEGNRIFEEKKNHNFEVTQTGDFRLTHEQREVGQSQESDAWEPGQRARNLPEPSCKQTQFSFHTLYNHTYVQSARMREIGMRSI